MFEPPPLPKFEPFLRVPNSREGKPAARPRKRPTRKPIDYQAEVAAYRTAEAALLAQLTSGPLPERAEKQLRAAVSAISNLREPLSALEDGRIDRAAYSRYQEWSMRERHRLTTGYSWYCQKKAIELLGEYRSAERRDRDAEKLEKLDARDEKIEQLYGKFLDSH